MGYEDDMDDYYDDQNENKLPLTIGSIRFNRKNLISSNGVSFRKLMWNYLCWTLAGKPNDWRIDGT